MKSITNQQPARLEAAFPVWEHCDRDGFPTTEPRQVWSGKMRIVHSQRARKLRRRGVPLMDLRPRTGRGVNGYEGRAEYAWFVDDSLARYTQPGGAA
jgi:hypothetical protein